MHSTTSRVAHRLGAMAGIAAMVVASITLTAAPALAAGVITHSVSVTYAGTGYGTADECPVAADVSASDLVTCTNDSIGYQWNYNVTLSATPTIATFSQTVPAGFVFDTSNITVCQGSPSTFVGTGTITSNPDGSQTLTCELTFPAGGSLSGNLPISVTATGSVPNGTVIAPELTVTPDGGTPAAATPPAVTVVAEPSVDLIKQMNLLAQGPDVYDGRDGYLIFVSQGLMQRNPSGTGQRKGIEELATPVTWTDDLSDMPANSELVFTAADVYSTAGASPSNCRADTYYAFPTSEASDTAQITCVQSAPGQPIDFAITSADLSGTNTSGPFYQQGIVLSTGFILFVPSESVPVGPTGTLYTNQLTQFDPTSVSGQSNYGSGYEPGGAPGDTCVSPVSNNNCAGVQLFNGVEGAFSGTKWISTADSCTAQVAPGVNGNNTPYTFDIGCYMPGNANGTNGRPAYLTPGEPIYDQLDLQLPLGGFTNYSGVTLCDKWDPEEQQIDPSKPVYREVRTNNFSQTNVTVQYTTADYSDQTVRANAGCGIPGDDVTDGPWFDDVASAGGVENVSGIRVIDTTPGGLAPGLFLRVYVPLINVAPESNVPKVDQFAARWDSSTAPNASGTWPVAAASYLVTRSRTGIVKSTVPDITTAGAGTTVTFQLTPEFVSSDPSPEPEIITIVDSLPPCAVNPQTAAGTTDDWNVVVTPADVGPDGVYCTSDDVAGAVLTYTSVTPKLPNEPLPTITYSVVVAANAADLSSITNTAVISSPGSLDVLPALRTSAETLTIRSNAQITITKAVDQPVVEVTPDGVGWTVTVVNTSTSNAGRTEWIDVLPWIGDDRGTSFEGTLGITGVSALNNQVSSVEFTDAHPAAINPDPLHPSNAPGGTTPWCTESGLGSSGCPSDWSAITGVRFVVGNFAPGIVSGIRIEASPEGNAEGDVYVNQVGPGSAANLVEPLPESNPAQVEVIASSIGDRVWVDSNADGVQDVGEPGIPGVTVTLHDAAGGQIASTVTGADGAYLFDGYHSGTYSVRVDASTVPPQYGITYDLDDGTASPNGDSGGITLGQNSDFVDADFGYSLVELTFEVNKIVTDPEGLASGPFTIVVTCELDGGPVVGYPRTLEFDGEGSETLTAPRGSECTAVETVTGGATGVTVTPGITLALGGEAITITNDFRYGALRIHKELGGVGAAAFGNRMYVFSVSCSFDGQTVAEREVTVQRSGDEVSIESELLTGIPIGAVCVVSELDNGGADATPAPVTVTIVENGENNTTVASFLNEFSAGVISVTKVLDGSGAGTPYATDAEFTLVVTCQVELSTDPPTIGTVFSGPVVVRGGESEVIRDGLGNPVLLPLGARCWAVETDQGYAQRTAVNFDSYTNAAVVSAGSPNDLQEIEITATNTFVLAELVITKKVVGPGSPGPYKFAVECTLDGVPFPLPDSDSSFTLSHGESHTVALLEGVDCVVTEVDPPSDAIVDVEDSDGSTSGGTTDGRVGDLSGEASVTITNTYRTLSGLASTGQETALGIVMAALAMLCGGLLLWTRRRRMG